MEIRCVINGKAVAGQTGEDTVLLDFLREQGCYSVKRGCETSNCGLCTVWLDGRPVLSCSVPAGRADGRQITTLEGVQQEAKEFGEFLAAQGAEQCGFCSPGFIMNVLAMVRELEDPDEEEIREYLAGNLCRCTGYMGQMRAVRAYLKLRREHPQDSAQGADRVPAEIIMQGAGCTSKEGAVQAAVYRASDGSAVQAAVYRASDGSAVQAAVYRASDGSAVPKAAAGEEGEGHV